MAKTAIVTGAGTGIGRESAKALSKSGYVTYLVGRRKEALDETAAMGEGELRVASADITKPDEVNALFERVEKEEGRLDVLFNNAGMGAPAIPMEELSFEQWQDVVNINLTASFLCSQKAVAIMKKQTPQGGRIINNGSISAHVPRPLSAPYTATKHAITGLTRSLALDGRPYQIRASQIDIGNAATPMTKRMAGGVLQPDGSTKPEPTMDVTHVADMVLHIANLPLDANILFVNVMAPDMPFVGRG